MFTRRKQVSICYSCSQVRRTGMVRRGWHDTEWSKQWVQVLRGPRPPAAKWPRVRRQNPSNTPDSGGGLPNTAVRPQTTVTDRGPRRNPEDNCAAAQATVRRLEVALAAESDVAAREAIQASLVKARAAARVIPLSDRIRMSVLHREGASKKSWRCRLSRFPRRQKCRGCKHWWHSCSPNLSKLHPPHWLHLRIVGRKFLSRSDVVGKILSHIATKRCRSGCKGDKQICQRLSQQDCSRKFRGSHTS